MILTIVNGFLFGTGLVASLYFWEHFSHWYSDYKTLKKSRDYWRNRSQEWRDRCIKEKK